MDLSRVGKEARFRDPEVSSDWVMVGAIPVDELLKCEMEQAGLLFGGITNFLADISYALSSQKSAPTHPPTATAAKSLQSCPTLCDPIDGSPPGSSVPGILQARILEWVAPFPSPMHESEK